jgi:hypothetical protein
LPVDGDKAHVFAELLPGEEAKSPGSVKTR